LFGLSGTMQFPFPGPQPCASAAVFQNSARAGEEHELFHRTTSHATRLASALRSATADQAFRARSSRKAVCPESGGQDDCGPADLGFLWSGRDRDSGPRGGDEDHRNAVSVRTQDLNRRRGAEMAGGVLDHRQRRREFRHDVFHELRRLLGLGRDRRRLAPRGATVTQRKARVTRAVAPVTSARTVVWSLRSAMPRAGSSPSGALAFLASNRDPEVRHSLGFQRISRVLKPPRWCRTY
jgi:hypothetical protein